MAGAAWAGRAARRRRRLDRRQPAGRKGRVEGGKPAGRGLGDCAAVPAAAAVPPEHAVVRRGRQGRCGAACGAGAGHGRAGAGRGFRSRALHGHGGAVSGGCVQAFAGGHARCRPGAGQERRRHGRQGGHAVPGQAGARLRGGGEGMPHPARRRDRGCREGLAGRGRAPGGERCPGAAAAAQRDAGPGAREAAPRPGIACSQGRLDVRGVAAGRARSRPQGQAGCGGAGPLEAEAGSPGGRRRQPGLSRRRSGQAGGAQCVRAAAARAELLL